MTDIQQFAHEHGLVLQITYDPGFKATGIPGKWRATVPGTYAKVHDATRVYGTAETFDGALVDLCEKLAGATFFDPSHVGSTKTVTFPDDLGVDW